MEYFIHFLLTIIFLSLITYVCVLFTNSVENLGQEYGMQEGAVGGILAAIGTALPETIVPIVAVSSGFLAGKSVAVGKEVALGAVLGSPFLLSTVAFFVTGVSVLLCSFLKKRECKMCANPIILLRDLKFFLFSYTIAVSCAFVSSKIIKCFVALFLIIYYLWYVQRTLKKDFGCELDSNNVHELIFLKLFKQMKHHKRIFIILQVIFSLVGLVVISDLFVNEIKYFSQILHIHPMVMALLLAPVATELPECFNSAIWIGASKDSLSIANITGALVFQSCIPAAIGLVLTPWHFNVPAFFNVILVYFSIIFVYIFAFKNKGILNYRILIACGGFYVVYVVYVLKMLI